MEHILEPIEDSIDQRLDELLQENICEGPTFNTGNAPRRKEMQIEYRCQAQQPSNKNDQPRQRFYNELNQTWLLSNNSLPVLEQHSVTVCKRKTEEINRRPLGAVCVNTKPMSQVKHVQRTAKRISGNEYCNRRSKRQIASERERLRMQQISRELMNLKRHLPEYLFCDKNPSKIQILRNSITYIKNLSSFLYVDSKTQNLSL
uniref:BHLH transcription factor Mesp n=1 Tax=Ciona savignyi TaxID=51511 RepID=Q75UU3_CIOSA|nr:bHLH transcription factor Mesp [Ciona savignyi]